MQSGGTKSDASEWRNLHDVFNLVTLPIVSAANVSFLIMREEKFMWAQFYAFAAYVIADTVWVLLRPTKCGFSINNYHTSLCVFDRMDCSTFN